MFPLWFQCVYLSDMMHTMVYFSCISLKTGGGLAVPPGDREGQRGTPIYMHVVEEVHDDG